MVSAPAIPAPAGGAATARPIGHRFAAAQPGPEKGVGPADDAQPGAGPGHNLLREELPFPVAVLREDALRHNSAWMRDFIRASGTQLAPHGKTTMCPALFDLQLEDGAWAITLATLHQLQVAREFGYPRLFLANQLVGRHAIAWVLAELARDPGFDFYCLVDSAANVGELARAVRAAGPGRRLQVLVELGYSGGRTGCRSVEEALALARLVASHADCLALRGIEGFEGLIREPSEAATVARVHGFLDRVAALAAACGQEGLFADGTVILTAGGSAFFDLVATRLTAIRLPQDIQVVLRSGCYLTHDSTMYRYLFAQIAGRTPDLARFGEGLMPALEVWAHVQSRPEPGRAIAALGKRDASHDQLPVPLKWFRPGGAMAAPAAVPPGHTVSRLDDQHCYVTLPPESDWQVGDMVAFGISHPCLTFDKWRVIHVVDPHYTVVGSLRTYF